MNPADRTERVSLLLTPLSPIHVGCGVDFDPTGYVIDEGVLYAFEPAALPLSPQERKALMQCAEKSGVQALLAVQSFFRDRSALCQGHARLLLPVSRQLQQQYDRSIGKLTQREDEVINALRIERTAHHPHTGNAYIPGTGLKGSVRTAWLNRLNMAAGARLTPEEIEAPRKKRAEMLERRLLGMPPRGAFESDPFRLLSVSDAHGQNVDTIAAFATDHEIDADSTKLHEGLATRLEVIVPWQWAALQTLVTIRSLPVSREAAAGLPDPGKRIGSWRDLAATCNAYYLPRLRNDLKLMKQRRFGSPAWVDGIGLLLEAVGHHFECGDAMLLRVGRHSGALSVTLDGVRSISVRESKRRWVDQPEPTTIWLHADAVDARSDMQPFGWLLAHREGVDLPALREWCAAQPRPDVAAARQRLQQARAEAQRLAAEAAAREAERRTRETEAAQAAAREQARLASLSPQGREVEALRASLLAHTAARRQPVGGQLYAAVRQLVQQAEQGDWPQADRAELAALLRTLVPEKIDLGGKAKEIRQAAARLAGDA